MDGMPNLTTTSIGLKTRNGIVVFPQNIPILDLKMFKFQVFYSLFLITALKFY